MDWIGVGMNKKNAKFFERYNSDEFALEEIAFAMLVRACS